MAIDERDEHTYRGKELGGASASVSCGFRPSLLRYMYYESNTRSLLLFTVILLLAAALCGWGGYALIARGGWVFLVIGGVIAVLAVLLGLLGLVLGALTIAALNATAEYYQNALLSAGVVHSRDPLTVMVLAHLGNGTGAEYYGISRLDPARLPYHSHEPGTRVPCVCRFARGDAPDRWSAFETDFICYGTGNPALINQCFERLTNEPFERLENYLRNGRLPQNDNEIIVLDGYMNYLETTDKKAAMDAAKPPPGEENHG